MWRPPHTALSKWSNPYHLACHTRADHTDECKAFEAGADAMLEALRKEGLNNLECYGSFRVPVAGRFLEVDGVHQDYLALVEVPMKKKGYLVFIPEE